VSVIPQAIGELKAALQAVVGSEHVHRQKEPSRFVVKPSSAAEVTEVVTAVAAHGGIVTPAGSAAHLPSQFPEDREVVLVDLRRMDHVLRLDETSLVVRVQAGLTAHALEQVLTQRGLTLGDYPPAALGATIGGLLAVRTPGKSSRRHGYIEDAVLGISAVLPSGRMVHTRVAPRRATGPDLARVICGSEGTLGIITSAVMRIHRRAESRLLAAWALPNFEDTLSAVRTALREEAFPEAMRAYDSAEAGFHLGAEHLREGESVLVCATAGPTDLAACDRDLVASAVQAFGGRALPADVAETWWQRRMGRGSEPPAIPSMQISATLGHLPAVYRAICAAAESSGASARGHASRFDVDGAVLFVTLTDARNDVVEGDAPALDIVKAAARDAGAYLLGALNEGMGPYLSGLRDALDPGRVFNPEVLDRE